MDRVDEEVFPHSYNPKMTLNMTQTSTQNTRARSGRKKSTVVEDKPTNIAAEVDETLKEENAVPEEAMDEDEDKGDEGGMTEDIAKFDKLIGENSRSAAVGSEQRRSLRMKLSLGDEDGALLERSRRSCEPAGPKFARTCMINFHEHHRQI